MSTPAATRAGWLDATDHRRVGLIGVLASLALLAVGALTSLLLYADFGAGGGKFLHGDSVGRAFVASTTAIAVLALPGLWGSLAVAITPLQIGANRVAFPRAQAMAVWTFIFGGLLAMVGPLLDRFSVWPGVVLASTPESFKGGGPIANDLYVVGLLLVGLATLVTALDLVVTIGKLRVPSMRFANMPLFSWSVLIGAALLTVTTPVFLAGLSLLYIDQHFGASLFATDGGQLVWQHMVWLFGRPDSILLGLAGLGAACDIVASRAGRALIGGPIAHIALGAIGALSLTAWASGPSAAYSIFAPVSNLGAAAVGLPLSLLTLLWAGTVFQGKPRMHPSLLLVIASELVAAFAVLNAAVALLLGARDHGVSGGAWSLGFIHTAVLGGPILLGAAALWHWAPRLVGRPLAAGAGALATLLLLGGVIVHGGAQFLAGYNGFQVLEFGGDGAQLNLNRLAALGAGLLLLGALVVLGEVARAAFAKPLAATGSGDAADESELTLEWLASADGQPNFTSVPAVRSSTPLADDRAVATAGGTR